jgi:menaquinone-dependent protoporphyrinogen oxidase
MMKVCIVYDSRRGSTEKVARAMERALRERGFEARAWSAGQNPDVDDCDLVVIGAPIYYERPLPGIRRFIASKNGLKGKRVAVFILCIADRFGKLGRRYTERRYLRMMTEPIEGRIIAARVFDGWIMGENKGTIEEARDWIMRVVKAFEDGRELGIEHPG